MWLWWLVIGAISSNTAIRSHEISCKAVVEISLPLSFHTPSSWWEFQAYSQYKFLIFSSELFLITPEPFPDILFIKFINGTLMELTFVM